MTLHKEFADILKEKLGEFPSEDTPKPFKSPKRDLNFQPILSFFTDVKTWIPKHGLKSYPQKKCTQWKQETPKKHKLSFSKPIKKRTQPEKFHSLSELSLSSQKAYISLQKLGATLPSQQFQISTLKREYRRLIKLFHPDHSQSTSSQSFQMVLKNYRTLIKELQ